MDCVSYVAIDFTCFPVIFLYLLSLCPAVSLRPDVLPVSALIAYYSANPSPILLLLFLFFLLFSLFHSHVPLLTLPLSFPLPALVPVPLHSSSHQFVPSPFLLSPSLPSSPFSNSPCPTRSISLHSDSFQSRSMIFNPTRSAALLQRRSIGPFRASLTSRPYDHFRSRLSTSCCATLFLQRSAKVIPFFLFSYAQIIEKKRCFILGYRISATVVIR